ncbi:MAG: hypothetical protein ACI4CY_04520 [Candidatus Gastranaerophilaceae bacterium]
MSDGININQMKQALIAGLFAAAKNVDVDVKVEGEGEEKVTIRVDEEEDSSVTFADEEDVLGGEPEEVKSEASGEVVISDAVSENAAAEGETEMLVNQAEIEVGQIDLGEGVDETTTVSVEATVDGEVDVPAAQSGDVSVEAGAVNEFSIPSSNISITDGSNDSAGAISGQSGVGESKTLSVDDLLAGGLIQEDSALYSFMNRSLNSVSSLISDINDDNLLNDGKISFLGAEKAEDKTETVTADDFSDVRQEATPSMFSLRVGQSSDESSQYAQAVDDSANEVFSQQIVSSSTVDSADIQSVSKFAATDSLSAVQTTVSLSVVNSTSAGNITLTLDGLLQLMDSKLQSAVLEQAKANKAYQDIREISDDKTRRSEYPDLLKMSISSYESISSGLTTVDNCRVALEKRLAQLTPGTSEYDSIESLIKHADTVEERLQTYLANTEVCVEGVRSYRVVATKPEPADRDVAGACTSVSQLVTNSEEQYQKALVSKSEETGLYDKDVLSVSLSNAVAYIPHAKTQLILIEDAIKDYQSMLADTDPDSPAYAEIKEKYTNAQASLIEQNQNYDILLENVEKIRKLFRDQVEIDFSSYVEIINNAAKEVDRLHSDAETTFDEVKDSKDKDKINDAINKVTQDKVQAETERDKALDALQELEKLLTDPDVIGTDTYDEILDETIKGGEKIDKMNEQIDDMGKIIDNLKNLDVGGIDDLDNKLLDIDHKIEENYNIDRKKNYNSVHVIAPSVDRTSPDAIEDALKQIEADYKDAKAAYDDTMNVQLPALEDLLRLPEATDEDKAKINAEIDKWTPVATDQMKKWVDEIAAIKLELEQAKEISIDVDKYVKRIEADYSAFTVAKSEAEATFESVKDLKTKADLPKLESAKAAIEKLRDSVSDDVADANDAFSGKTPNGSLKSMLEEYFGNEKALEIINAGIAKTEGKVDEMNKGFPGVFNTLIDKIDDIIQEIKDKDIDDELEGLKKDLSKYADYVNQQHVEAKGTFDEANNSTDPVVVKKAQDEISDNIDNAKGDDGQQGALDVKDEFNALEAKYADDPEVLKKIEDAKDDCKLDDTLADIDNKIKEMEGLKVQLGTREKVLADCDKYKKVIESAYQDYNVQKSSAENKFNEVKDLKTKEDLPTLEAAKAYIEGLKEQAGKDRDAGVDAYEGTTANGSLTMMLDDYADDDDSLAIIRDAMTETKPKVDAMKQGFPGDFDTLLDKIQDIIDDIKVTDIEDELEELKKDIDKYAKYVNEQDKEATATFNKANNSTDLNEVKQARADIQANISNAEGSDGQKGALGVKAEFDALAEKYADDPKISKMVADARSECDLDGKLDIIAKEIEAMKKLDVQLGTKESLLVDLSEFTDRIDKDVEQFDDKLDKAEDTFDGVKDSISPEEIQDAIDKIKDLKEKAIPDADDGHDAYGENGLQNPELREKYPDEDSQKLIDDTIKDYKEPVDGLDPSKFDPLIKELEDKLSSLPELDKLKEQIEKAWNATNNDEGLTNDAFDGAKNSDNPAEIEKAISVIDGLIKDAEKTQLPSAVEARDAIAAIKADLEAKGVTGKALEVCDDALKFADEKINGTGAVQDTGITDMIDRMKEKRLELVNKISDIDPAGDYSVGTDLVKQANVVLDKAKGYLNAVNDDNEIKNVQDITLNIIDALDNIPQDLKDVNNLFTDLKEKANALNVSANAVSTAKSALDNYDEVKLLADLKSKANKLNAYADTLVTTVSGKKYVPGTTKTQTVQKTSSLSDVAELYKQMIGGRSTATYMSGYSSNTVWSESSDSATYTRGGRIYDKSTNKCIYNDGSNVLAETIAFGRYNSLSFTPVTVNGYKCYKLGGVSSTQGTFIISEKQYEAYKTLKSIAGSKGLSPNSELGLANFEKLLNGETIVISNSSGYNSTTFAGKRYPQTTGTAYSLQNSYTYTTTETVTTSGTYVSYTSDEKSAAVDTYNDYVDAYNDALDALRESLEESGGNTANLPKEAKYCKRPTADNVNKAKNEATAIKSAANSSALQADVDADVKKELDALKTAVSEYNKASEEYNETRKNLLDKAPDEIDKQVPGESSSITGSVTTSTPTASDIATVVKKSETIKSGANAPELEKAIDDYNDEQLQEYTDAIKAYNDAVDEYNKLVGENEKLEKINEDTLKDFEAVKKAAEEANAKIAEVRKRTEAAKVEKFEDYKNEIEKQPGGYNALADEFNTKTGENVKKQTPTEDADAAVKQAQASVDESETGVYGKVGGSESDFTADSVYGKYQSYLDEKEIADQIGKLEDAYNGYRDAAKEYSKIASADPVDVAKAKEAQAKVSAAAAGLKEVGDDTVDKFVLDTTNPTTADEIKADAEKVRIASRSNDLVDAVNTQIDKLRKGSAVDTLSALNDLLG